jgi:hypothetical protein
VGEAAELPARGVRDALKRGATATAAEERGVAPGADAAKAGIVHAALVDVLGQRLLGITQTLAGIQPGLQAHAVFDQLLLARLDGEVALREGDRFLARIAVLRDEVAGVAGQLGRPCARPAS